MPHIPNNLDFLMNQASFLILEDVANFRSQLIQNMRAMKITGSIHEADNVKDAHEIVNEKKIDFIICDWNLPDGTGYDFLVAVRKMPQHTTTPFLMWTTMNEVPNILNAIAAGASEYFFKPWTPEELEIKIMQSWSKVHGNKKF